MIGLANGICLLFSLYLLWWFYGNQAVCVLCGGRGKHKDGCRNAD